MTRPLSGPSSLPSTQTLIQAGPPRMFTTRVTPLKATVIRRVSDAVLPSAEVAVTVIAQLPAVRSSGGSANVPSSLTSTVVPGPGAVEGPGAPDGATAGAGVGDAPGASAPAPRNAAVTVTVSAFVVVPSTAIAPLP